MPEGGEPLFNNNYKRVKVIDQSNNNSWCVLGF